MTTETTGFSFCNMVFTAAAFKGVAIKCLEMISLEFKKEKSKDLLY